MSRDSDNRNGITIVQNKLLGGSGITIQLDAVISEDNSSTLNITEFPVELGTITTDNAVIVPKTYKLNGTVSKVKTQSGFPRGGEFQSLSPRASYEDLIRLQQSRDPFDVVTGLFTYKNMLIASIDASQDKDSANSLIFTAALEQIQVAESQSVPLPRHKIAPSANDRGASTDDQGTKSPDEQGKVNDPVNQSYLRKLTVGSSAFFRG